MDIWYVTKPTFLHAISREYYQVVDFDIHGCYSLVKIAFAPIWACENNRPIRRHNTSTLCSCDVTDQLLWRHNAKSEKTLFGENGEMMVRWFFLAESVCSGHKITCKK